MSARDIWMDTEVSPAAPMLDQDLTVDTVIVGAGIAGLSTVMNSPWREERSQCGSSADRRWLHCANYSAFDISLRRILKNLIDVQVIDAAKQFCESQAASIDRIEKIQ